jgi:hypothetical protein
VENEINIKRGVIYCNAYFIEGVIILGTDVIMS